MGFTTSLLLAGIALIGTWFTFQKVRKSLKQRYLPIYSQKHMVTFAGYQKIQLRFHPKRGMNTSMHLTCPGYTMVRECELGHKDFSPKLEIHCLTLCSSNADSSWTEDILFKSTTSVPGRPSPEPVADVCNPSF